MKIALWLLDRLDVPDAIVGDIIERSFGKSTRWFFWQAVGAVLTWIAANVRRHPWMLVRGVALGVLLVKAVDAGFRLTLLPFDNWLGRVVYDYLLVGRTNMILLVSVVNALLVAPCWFAIGWLVVRWHARYIALIVVALVCADVLPHDVRQLVLGFPHLHSMRFWTIDIVSMTVWITSFTAALLAGALSVKRDARSLA